MTTSLIRGRWLVTRAERDGSANVIPDGALAHDEGRILEVGAFPELRARHASASVLGTPDHVVLPGFVNAHHHVGMTPFQTGVPDLPLETWIPARWAARGLARRLDTLYGCLKMIESGITTVMHNDTAPLFPDPDGRIADDGPLQTLAAYREAGMRVAFSSFVRNHHPIVYADDEAFVAALPPEARDFARRRFVSISSEAYLDLCRRVFAAAGRNRDGRVRVLLAPGNQVWCPDPFLRDVKEEAAALGTGIHMHLGETLYQYAYARNEWSESPVAHAERIGFLGPEVSVAHAVWTDAEDHARLAQSGTIVCTNPSSNLRLASGIAPINAMLDAGVDVALGIDEAGLNDDNDMLFEMRLGHALRSEPGVDTRSPTAAEQLWMATQAGARATGFGDAIGALEPGRRADVVLLDLRRLESPWLSPSVGVLDALVRRGQARDVDTVVIDGEIVYRDRASTRIDHDSVFAEIQEALDRPPTEEERHRARVMAELGQRVAEFYTRWPAAKLVDLQRSATSRR